MSPKSNDDAHAPLFVLPERDVDQIAEYTHSKGNTYFLVKVLRASGEIPPKLRTLAADVLQGKVVATWKPLPPSRMHKAFVRADIDRAKELLKDGDANALEMAALMKIQGAEDGRRREAAARAIVAHEYGISPDAVKRLLFPQSGREPKRPRKIARLKTV